MHGMFTYIYLKKSTIHVGKYPSPMDGLHVIHRKNLSNQADYLNDIWYLEDPGRLYITY